MKPKEKMPVAKANFTENPILPLEKKQEILTPRIMENPAVTLGDIFSKLTPQERQETIEKILLELIRPENLGLKADIQMPTNFTRLEIIAFWAKIEGAEQTYNLLQEFCRLFRVNWISHDRGSRKEITGVLAERFKQDKSLEERLLEPST